MAVREATREEADRIRSLVETLRTLLQGGV